MFSGEDNLGPWKNEIAQAALAPGPGTDSPQGTLVLAANRTKRPDILRGFRRYRGGWDIANQHYWAVSTTINPYPFRSAMDNCCVVNANSIMLSEIPASYNSWIAL